MLAFMTRRALAKIPDTLAHILTKQELAPVLVSSSAMHGPRVMRTPTTKQMNVETRYATPQTRCRGIPAPGW